MGLVCKTLGFLTIFFWLVRSAFSFCDHFGLDPNDSLRIHSRLSTIRETRLPPRRPLLPIRKLSLLRPSPIQRPSQRTTTATPSTAVVDALQPVMAREPTIAGVEPAAERRSRREVAVPATGARTKTRPKRPRDASTRTRLPLSRKPRRPRLLLLRNQRRRTTP